MTYTKRMPDFYDPDRRRDRERQEGRKQGAAVSGLGNIFSHNSEMIESRAAKPHYRVGTEEKTKRRTFILLDYLRDEIGCVSEYSFFFTMMGKLCYGFVLPVG